MLTYTLMKLDHQITRCTDAQVPNVNAATWEELHQVLAGMRYSVIISWERNVPVELHWYRSPAPDPHKVAPATLCLLRQTMLQYVDGLLASSPFRPGRPGLAESN